MEEMIKTVYEGGEGEIIEKKSRFIATIRPVKTEEEASAFFAEMKKKYWDAKHNCTAFVLGQKQELTRSSDDGEPSGTAGRPMLDVLVKEHITDVAVVVTRYFGGVLLGTGGLVRAYQQAVIEGLKNCALIEKQPGILYSITTDYTGLGKLQYLFAQEEVPVLDTEYTDQVTIRLVIAVALAHGLEKKITEATAATAGIEKTGECVFALVGGKVVIC